MADPLEEVRRTASIARRAVDRAEDTAIVRDAAIVAAWRAGVSVRDIASAAGLSHQRVSQIVRRDA